MPDPVAAVNVVGSGPNGLAAAVILARAGLEVRVYEASDTPGGGARTAELIEPAAWHDICSAVHPGALASPFFRQFGLSERIDFVTPEIAYGQAQTDRPALLAWNDLGRTVEALGRSGRGWQRVFEPLVERFEALTELTTDNPLRAVRQLPTATRFGVRALRQWQPVRAARGLVGPAADLLSGVEAHVNYPLSALSAPLTGLTLASYAHTVGWPIPVGGSRSIVAALVDDLTIHGGTIRLGHRVSTLDELPAAGATLFDTSLSSLLEIAGERVPAGYRRRAGLFRGGAGIGKVDYLLSEEVPWSDSDLGRASTVHLGGRRADIARAEWAVHRGRLPDRPTVIASAPTQFDPGRAAAGRHVLWAYTHLPAGSRLDPAELVTAEIERYAPGFRHTIVASKATSAAQVADYNPNYVGGDIYAGALSTRQVLARPIPAVNPWRVGRTDLYLCSSAATPGPGVHGMGGYRAASAALRHSFGWAGALPSLGPTAG